MGPRRRRHHWIERTGPGRYAIDLPEGDRAALAGMVEDLRDLLLATTDDPLVRRLFPTAYNEDPGRDQEYQQLVRDELLEKRLAALATVEATVDAQDVDEPTLTAWMTALNDLRLVLGTRLDVSEGGEDIDPSDPDASAHLVYHYLSLLVGEAVDALERDLPEPSEPEV